MNPAIEDGWEWTKFFESMLSTVSSLLRQNRFDDTTCELLSSNIDIFKKSSWELTTSMEYTLINIIEECACKCYSSEILEDMDIPRLLDAIRVVSSISNSDIIVRYLENVTSESIAALEKALKCVDDGHQLSVTVNILRLMDVLFTTFLKKYQFADFKTISFNDRNRLESSIFQILLLKDSKLVISSLCIISSYYHLTRSSSFIERIWEILGVHFSYGPCIEMGVTIFSQVLRLQIEFKKELTMANLLTSQDLLKSCFEGNAAVRKHALSVLKYAVSNNAFKPEFSPWWNTYFVIADSLDEKQSHLVLPALRLMRNLRHSRICFEEEIDDFWLLNLLEQAMMHDSRSVRLEAFVLLFEWDVQYFNLTHVKILVRILRTCNDSSLFRKMLLTKNFDTFQDSFVKWVNKVTSTNEGYSLSELLFDDILIQKWSPIPLYYVLENLSRCSRLWPENRYDHRMNAFMMDVTHSHNVVVRSAVQVLFLRILLKSRNEVFPHALQIFEFLNFCNVKECLRRETLLWSEIVEFIRPRVHRNNVEMYLLQELSEKVNCAERSSIKTLHGLARNIIFLHDAYQILDCRRVREYFSRLASFLKNARSDPYANMKVIDNYLKLVVRLLQCGISVDVVTECECVEMVTYVLESIEKCGSDLAQVDFYFSCLEELISGKTFVLDQDLGALIDEWLPRICRDLSLYKCAVLTRWICELSLRGKTHLYSETWRKVIDFRIRDHVKAYGEKSFILDRSKNPVEGDYSTAVSNYVDTFWYLLSWCTKDKDGYLHECLEAATIIDMVFEALQLARNENLASVFRALEHVCRDTVILSVTESVRRLIDDSWKRLEEIQATPYYECAARLWIAAFIQDSVLQRGSYENEIEYCVREFLKKSAENGEQAFKHVNVIVEHLSKIEHIHVIFPPVINILVDTFCTAHMSRKDQRIEHETMNRIRLQYGAYMSPEVMNTNFVFSYEENRLRVLNLILRIIEEHSLAICITIIEALVTRMADSSKKRYFGDSLFHRTKHKELQLLLVLEFALHRRYDQHAVPTVSCYDKIYNLTVRNLLGEPHQPSVRYMLEWLLVRIVLHRFSQFEEKFWSSFSEASEERIGSICSFIMVAFHLANVLKNEQFVEKAVNTILPWSMAQHFNARLYAQSVLTKLINLNENVREKYGAIENGLASCLKRGNAVKNSVKLQEDFYFCRFHPEEHFTFQTIFWELPRLSNISRDEWIQVDLYEKFLTQDSGIRLYEESSNRLSSFECSSWVAKASTTSNEDGVMVAAADSGETQRKFIPEDLAGGDGAGGRRKRSELVVVATLVDRTPNLGGLTRTCEIFVVSELVLDSLDVVRKKDFTSLSITAEKHVPMTEVKRHNLFTYLKNMKEKRYCVVGVEQATNSRSLDNFTFPTKSIIVLGNEKEGIPADLLPVLDVCVEIPQVGVIRSLNVHVSASLIIWEYAKQHNIFASS